jgi:hypothetical protein
MPWASGVLGGPREEGELERARTTLPGTGKLFLTLRTIHHESDCLVEG